MNYKTIGTLTLCSFALIACEDTLYNAAAEQAQYNAFLDTKADSATVEASLGSELTAAPSTDTVQLNGVYSVTAEDLSVSSVSSPDVQIGGEVSMTVDFGANEISGTLSNSYLAPEEDTVAVLDGTIAFTGDIDFVDGFYDSTNTTEWQLEGDVIGTLTDSPDHDDTTSDTTYQLDLDINGDFYDTSSVGTVGGVGDVGDVASLGQLEGSIDVTTTTDSLIYRVTDGDYFVFELED